MQLKYQCILKNLHLFLQIFPTVQNTNSRWRITKFKSYLQRDKYFEDYEVGNKTLCIDINHQYQLATNTLSERCVKNVYGIIWSGVGATSLCISIIGYYFSCWEKNDDSQIKTMSQCCCYTSSEKAKSQSTLRGCRKAQICLCLEDTCPSKYPYACVQKFGKQSGVIYCL